MLVEGDKVGEWTPHSGEIYNDTTEITGAGVKVKHNNGSYTQMKSDGFYRYDTGSNRDYHYLQYVGTYTSIGTGPAFWIQLPDEFKGKNFQVTLSASSFNGNNYPLTDRFVNSYLSVYSYDRANGKFSVVAYWQVSNGSTIDTKPTTFTYTAIV